MEVSRELGQDAGVASGWVRGRPLTDFGRGRPNPSAGSGQVLTLPLERVKSGGAVRGVTPNTDAHGIRLV